MPYKDPSKRKVVNRRYYLNRKYRELSEQINDLESRGRSTSELRRKRKEIERQLEEFEEFHRIADEFYQKKLDRVVGGVAETGGMRVSPEVASSSGIPQPQPLPQHLEDLPDDTLKKIERGTSSLMFDRVPPDSHEFRLNEDGEPEPVPPKKKRIGWLKIVE